MAALVFIGSIEVAEMVVEVVLVGGACWGEETCKKRQ